MIIIVGSGRSGTTWLAKLVDSHPDVFYRHEPDSLDHNPSIPFLPDPGSVDPYLAPTADYLKRLLAERRLKSSGSLPIFEKSYRGPVCTAALRGAVFAAKAIERILGGRRTRSWLRVPDLIGNVHSAPVPVIKSVSSLGRSFLFSRAAPEARIVHIVRHPCGVIGSLLRGVASNLMRRQVFLDDLFRSSQAGKYPFTPEDMQNRTIEEKLAFQWMVMNDKVADEMDGSDRYFQVIYDDLCVRTEPILRDVLAFAGLSWDPQVEHMVAESIRTDGNENPTYFSINKSPTKSAGRWKADLTADQIQRILAITAHSRFAPAFSGP